MNLSAWSPLGVAAFGLAGALFQQRRRRPLAREQLKVDLELWSALPNESSARSALLENIDSRVERLITEETEHRRDWSGVTIALILIGTFGWLTWLAWVAGGAYRFLEIAVLPMLLMGIFGFFTSIGNKKRDERGNAEPDRA